MLIILWNSTVMMTSLPSGSNIIFYEGLEGRKKAHIYRAIAETTNQEMSMFGEKYNFWPFLVQKYEFLM